MSETEKKKLGLWDYIKPLFCDNGSGLSLGRIAFWILLATAIPIWQYSDTDIKTYHFYTLGILLMYNLSKKAPMFIKLIKAWKGTDTNDGG